MKALRQGSVGLGAASHPGHATLATIPHELSPVTYMQLDRAARELAKENSNE